MVDHPRRELRQPAITRAAVLAYQRARQLEGGGWKRTPAYLQADLALRRELGLRPWQCSPLDPTPHLEGYETAAELRRMLEEACE
jgi:hypothetical protein